jgi:ribokinase
MNTHDGVRLVLVGHFGFAEDHTSFGSALNRGGSGYACAIGAAAGEPELVGVVANIGEDFGLEALDQLGVDMSGAVVVAGRAPRLTITQHTPTDRSFESVLGVAATPATNIFPPAYANASHLHLATMPPGEQMHWLQTVRSLSKCTISVDMFERNARDFPDESRQLCYSADMVFMNAEERRLLFSDHPLPTREIVLKSGADGAAFRSEGNWVRVPAPQYDVVDTTGAGEVLAGAFLSLRVMGVADHIALKYAVEAASAKVSEFGVDGGNLRRALARIHATVAADRGKPHLAPGPWRP